MTPYGYIYITINRVNGKQYIGQNSYSARVTDRYLGSGKYLKLAIQKYGRSTFQKDIIFEAFSFDDLNWAERHFISECNAVQSRDFYNQSPGGKASLGFTGRKQSDAFKLSMSERFKGQTQTDEAKKKMKDAWVKKKERGYKQTPNPNQTEIARTVGLANRGKTHIKKECPYCLKHIGPGPYAKFHGAKCKSSTNKAL